MLLGGAHGRAVEDWADMRDALAKGEVDDEAYARWRDRYGMGEGLGDLG